MPVNHLAIIMDGNRRWAKERGLPSLEGHRKGYERLKSLAAAVIARGITTLTVFAFSTENWKRTEEEVGYLMDLLEMALTKELSVFHDKNLRMKVIGRREGLRPSIRRAIEQAEELTKNNTAGTLCLCVNYGGRAEIIDAVRSLVRDGVGEEAIDEQAISSRLSWPDMPEPDLVVRTSGEERLSGFLTWESVYSEIFWCEKHWPDFDEGELDKALEAYEARQRRYGK